MSIPVIVPIEDCDWRVISELIDDPANTDIDRDESSNETNNSSDNSIRPFACDVMFVTTIFILIKNHL